MNTAAAVSKKGWGAGSPSGREGARTFGLGGPVNVCPAESKTLLSGRGEQGWGHTEHLTEDEESEKWVWGAHGKWGAWERGEWECDMLQQFYCFSPSMWCDREWMGFTFLQFLTHSCHIGWFAGIYQRIHLNFLFISEICCRGICRSFAMDVFFLCLRKSKDQPTNFHISLLI